MGIGIKHVQMIQCNELVDFSCPACGYICKGRNRAVLFCPKCFIHEDNWYSNELRKQPDIGGNDGK